MKSISSENTWDYRRSIAEALDEIVSVSLKNRYLYTQISKSGSSAVKSILQKMEFQDLANPPKIQVNNRFYSPHVRPFQISEGNLQEIFRSDTFFKFTFVRDPYSRILSCYLHRVAGKGRPNNPTKKSIERFTGKSIDDWQPSFSDFVNVVADMRPDQMEAHFLPQKIASLFGTISYSFIGKLEKFDEDVDYVLSEIGLKGNAKRELVRGAQAKSPQITNASQRLTEYFSKPLYEKVQKIYEEDFKVFQYNL